MSPILINLLIILVSVVPVADITSSKRDPAHRHSKLSDVRDEVAAEIDVFEVRMKSSYTRENITRSPNGRFEAFTVFKERGSPENILLIIDTTTRRVYEVRNVPLPHRPFSDLVWVNNRKLVFDRWSQPHYGVHYAVDMIKKKLVTAAAFPG